MGKVLQIMQDMNAKNNEGPEEEKKPFGVFVMSRETIRRFRKEARSFGGVFLGHKVRMLKSCPNEKIYLMSNEDFHTLKYGMETAKEDQIEKIQTEAKMVRLN
jgi:hypothetical protein